ncbi:MAG: DUF4097 family beta strand repeat-containing protein [Gemmatimonadales bacterium]
MRHAVLILGFTLLALPVTSSRAGLVAQERVERGYRAAPDVVLRIFNLAGRTRVVAWDLDSVSVTGTLSPGGRFFGGGDGRMIKLGVEDPQGRQPKASLEVRIPRRARLWVKSGSADVAVSGVSGELEVMSVTGAVELEGTPRVATLESIEGNVTVTGAATVLRVRTGGGSVRISEVRGDLSVVTVAGGISINSTEILSARLETASGAVTFRSSIAPDGRLEVDSHDGTVDLALPPAIDGRFDLASVRGQLTVELPGYRPKRGDLRSAAFSTGKRSGAGGGVAVTVRTFSGQVRINSNPAPTGGI